jgi:hypothetical protein
MYLPQNIEVSGLTKSNSHYFSQFFNEHGSLETASTASFSGRSA